MLGLAHELRFALRSLRRNPGFTLGALAILGLGIGITTAVFSIVQAVMLRGLPYPAVERLVAVWETDAHADSFAEGLSAPDLLDLRAQSHGFERVEALSRPELNLRVGDHLPVRVPAGAVTPGLLPLLGARPALGRLLVATDDRPHGARVAVLSAALWRDELGADPRVVGRTVRLDGEACEVVGVLDPAFHYGALELYVPLSQGTPFLDLRGVHNLRAVGRLRPGVTLAAATAEVTALGEALAARYPDDNVGRGFRLEPLREAELGPLAREVRVVGGAVLLLLLIACANVGGLWLLRTHGRRREIAVRLALGAGRDDLARLLGLEALVLSLASAAAGVALAPLVLRALLALRGRDLPQELVVRVDRGALVFAGALALLTALLFGLLPLLGGGLRRLAGALGRRGGGNAPAASARALLVVAEVALAMVLVTGTTLLARSMTNLLRESPGYDPGSVVSFGVQLPDARYPMPARTLYPRWPEVVSAYRRIAEQVGALPGVQRVVLAADHPAEAGFTTQVQVVGRPAAPGPVDEVRVRPVSAGYEEMLRVPLLAGRALDLTDRAGGPQVTLVNAALARKYFPRQPAVGQALTFWGQELRIVGVIGDERFLGLDKPSEPAIYPSLEQLPFAGFRLLVQARVPPAELEREVRAAVAALEPDMALYQVQPLRALLGATYAPRRFMTTLLGSFAGLALLLAAVGLYGLLSFQVAQRRHELGVRRALGAARGALLRLTAVEAARHALAGVLIGAVVSLGATRWLATLLYDVAPLDPLSIALAALLLLAVAVVAVWRPAARAAGADPAAALRNADA